MTLTRVPFQTQARAGAVSLLEAFAADAMIRLQVYRARPRSLNPPTAFVDAINETLSEYTVTTRQRRPTVEVMVVHGLFDTGEAADQRDAFVDGFADWVADNFHAFGSNTLVAAVAIEDVPVFIPDWLPEAERRTYYATRVSLEGFAAT